MGSPLGNILAIGKRELHAYFASPLAYVFIIIFLVLSGFFTFAPPPFGNFFGTNEASLTPFFMFQPWLCLILVPAVAMRLWAEEQRSGTMELLFTMPVSVAEAVAGKFLAAWAVLASALAMTFPLVITVNHLGSPDNGVIACGYLGCLLLSGAFLALGCMTSALTRNQVISFVLNVAICLALLLLEHHSVSEFFTRWAPEWLTDALGATGALGHFFTMQKGVLDARDVLYFLSLIAFGLFSTGVALQSRRRAWN